MVYCALEINTRENLMKKIIAVMILAAALMFTACDPGRRSSEDPVVTKPTTVTSAATHVPDGALADMTVEQLKDKIIDSVGYVEDDNFGSKETQVIDAKFNPSLGKISRYNFVHFDRTAATFDVLFDLYEFEDPSVTASLKTGDKLEIKVDAEQSKVSPDDTITITAVNGKFAIVIKDYADVKGGEVPPANVTGTFTSGKAQIVYDRFVGFN